MNPYSYSDESTYGGGGFAADAELSSRMGFIRRTYTHVFGGILAFILLEVMYFKSGFADSAVQVLAGGRGAWLIALGLFMGVSWLATKWAQSDVSIQKQYLGLGLYIFAESIIFIPILWMASRFYPNAIPTAAFLTMVVFGSLTFMVFVTKKDFSFMRGALTIGGLIAMGLIVASLIFGFDLGIMFAGAMVLLLSGYILYDTSNILHHYRTDQHVCAALALFGSVATLFFYMLRLVMYFADGD